MTRATRRSPQAARDASRGQAWDVEGRPTQAQNWIREQAISSARQEACCAERE
jgi:hypothetical protein